MKYIYEQEIRVGRHYVRHLLSKLFFNLEIIENEVAFLSVGDKHRNNQMGE
jgi:hypothetical protein